MAYPQSGAGYRYNPEWLDRAKRAEGGGVDAPEKSQHSRLNEMAQQDALPPSQLGDMGLGQSPLNAPAGSAGDDGVRRLNDLMNTPPKN